MFNVDHFHITTFSYFLITKRNVQLCVVAHSHILTFPHSHNR